MAPIPLVPVVFLVLFAEVSGNSRTYWPVKTSISKRISGATISLRHTALSETHCAMQANMLNWTTLMCYQEPDCYLFNIPVWGDQWDNEDDSLYCYTNLGPSFPCAPGWTKGNRFCHLFSSTAETWLDARDYCLGLGSDLVKIDTQEENEYIKDLIQTDTWTGLSDKNSRDIYRWSADSPDFPARWEPKEPNNYGGNEHCVRIELPFALFDDGKCSGIERHYLCEKVATFDSANYVFSCPAGWETFQGSCYYISSDTREYQDAKTTCESLGAMLSQPIRDEEFEFILGIITESVFIGLTDLAVEGLFQWGEYDGDIVTSDVWEQGSPSGGSRDCVFVSTTGKWTNELCTYKHKFICEIIP